MLMNKQLGLLGILHVNFCFCCLYGPRCNLSGVVAEGGIHMMEFCLWISFDMSLISNGVSSGFSGGVLRPLHLQYSSVKQSLFQELIWNRNNHKNSYQIDHKILQKNPKENSLVLSYAFPSTDINLLFETISNHNAFW